MAYLGRGLDKISNIEVLDNITFDGSSSYSITKGSVAFTPNSAQSLLISIDGVVQATNFSVNSSNIDFGVAIPSTSVCNFFLHYGTGVMTVPSDGSVTTAKLGSNAVSSAKMFSGFANGITMVDQWRVTSSVTLTSSPAFITSNWERNDNTGYASIGTGMTESSGVFTFPSTGIYSIEAIGSFYSSSGASTTNGFHINSTINNSSYTQQTQTLSSYSTTNDHSDSSAIFIFDVTDTSNCKVKFQQQGSNGVVRGATSDTRTHVTFTRLGDT